ncbi:CFA58-like protein [Mya arenaria]|uniref:CFA58-like protein n=1 Tax=Mya arenaria TaxID=6604 RepID=A0ABY7FH22_MYAAR|nr:CFA58-like protein [Mya arenaria]
MSKEEGGKEKASIEDSAFEALEKDFQDVLGELMGDRSLEKFRNEYEKLHKALKKSHESEKRLMQKCRELNAEIVANSAKVSTALKLSQEDQATIASLKKEIEKAWKMVDAAHEKETRARETIQSLKLEISNLSKLVEQGAGLTMGQEHSLQEIVKLREHLAQSSSTQQHLEEQKNEAEEKIQELSQDIQMRNNEAQRESRKRDKMEREMKQTKADLDGKQSEIKTMQTQILNERAIKDADILNTRFQKLQSDFENQLISTDTLAQENQARVAELKLKEDEVTQLKNETQRLNKTRETIQRKLQLEASKKQAEADKKQIDGLIRERDLLHKEMLKAVSATTKQLSLDVKVREMQIFDFKKKIAESETKLKQQQNLYEAVRSDRNLYSKNLIESQDEITEMKRKLRIMSHQIDQLKEEIQAKEALLVKEHLDHQRVEKEKETLKTELQKMKQLAAENKAYIEAQEAEERKLLKIISEADAERVRQKKELDQVISERDILGTQLVRRNDELALLYEKIKIQQSTLNKGEIQYNQRLEDIRVLKLEIKKLRREKGILQKSVANVEDLRREVYHIQRELLRERTRCKALEEELENPMNIHRWRKLEGSDPSQFENIQKIHTLQKRLIAKTEEVVEKELLIQEKEKLYLELKHILARQPGPEVAEQLSIYQQTLKEKTKQMKSMASELNMYESQVNEYKYEIERIARELQEVKKKYFMQKKKEQSFKEQERTLAQAGAPIIQPQRTEGPRFTGGGFNLKSTKTAA